MELTHDIARTRHIGVLFTEHDMDVVFGHASRVLVLLRGEIIAAGSPDEIRADPKVRQAYLGDESLCGPRPMTVASRHCRTCRRAMAARRSCSDFRFRCKPARWWR